ncbi:MAG: methionine ABC transporter permease [Tissierellia bacterium]|nr:methionine ABC transporter permease [Tissierellia bacterium]
MNRDSFEYLIKIVGPAFLDTLFMVVFTTLIAFVLGFAVAVVLIVTDKDGLKPNPIVYKTLDAIVNVIRSFPFIILMVAIIPFTRFIIGSSIGRKAALVPLIVATTPFIARLIESNLKEVDKGLIEAGKSFGASTTQIVFKIMVKEAIPSIISSLTFVVIAVLGSTAIAGTVGAGGLGSVAITYGYQSFNDTIMYGIVVILIILVQIIQLFGKKIYERSMK